MFGSIPKEVKEQDANTNVLSVGTKLYRFSRGSRVFIREFVVYSVHHTIRLGDQPGYVERMVQYDLNGRNIADIVDELDEGEIGKTYFLSKAELIEHFAIENGCNVKVVEVM